MLGVINQQSLCSAGTLPTHMYQCQFCAASCPGGYKPTLSPSAVCHMHSDTHTPKGQGSSNLWSLLLSHLLLCRPPPREERYRLFLFCPLPQGLSLPFPVGFKIPNLPSSPSLLHIISSSPPPPQAESFFLCSPAWYSPMHLSTSSTFHLFANRIGKSLPPPCLSPSPLLLAS